MHGSERRVLLLLAILVPSLVASTVSAGDWVHWRGPDRDGTADATGLPAAWTPGGEGMLWRADFVSRSTPVVGEGRVCVNGREGDGIERREVAACFDAFTGERLWIQGWPVYHTTVPWNRVGWPNPAYDPETGYLYVQGVGGLFFCFDSRDGTVVWSRNFIEEYGFMEGYGGRTQTPVVDGDRVVVTFASSGWGSEARPLHRFRVFDKRTGELLMVATPGGSMADKNTQSTPAIARVGDRRLWIHGNADGGIYAVDTETGETVWSYGLSKRGINTSVVVDGHVVYAAHSEENRDEGTMGRIVAIDARGSGDVTATHEIWRSPLAAGFSSPALAGGRLYLLDNSANLHALDAATGRHIWELDVGRVGKSSPVVADGRIYVTEVNGVFAIVEPGETEGRILDSDELSMPEGRYAEMYGSPAVAYGRVYFTTEEGLYALGVGDLPTEPGASPRLDLPRPGAAPAGTAPAHLRLEPVEGRLQPGGSVELELLAFDAVGRSLPAPAVEWSLEGLTGTIEGGVFTASSGGGSSAGRVVARAGELEAEARFRVLADLPLEEDFEGVEVGSRPSTMVGYVGRWAVAERDGGKVLEKGPSPIKIHRHITFLGSPDWHDYTIQADLLGTRTSRRVPDVGLIANGYTMELLGVHQKLQVRSWPSALRMAQEVELPWEADVWYTMKMRVDVEEDRAVIRGKVWPRDDEEPAEWTITVEDPMPIREGSPGLSGFSPTPIYWDNIRVTRNQP